MPKDKLFFNDMLLDRRALSVANDHDHGRIRRALAPAYSQKSILEQEPILVKHVDLLITRLKQEALDCRSVDLRHWYNFTTFDVIGDLAFGEGFGCLEGGSYHIWVRFILDFLYATTLLHVCHKFYPLNWVLTLMLPTSVMNKRERHSEMSLEKVRQRMETGSDRSN
jgi:cytochrome P450